jgi:hypothetical protein
MPKKFIFFLPKTTLFRMSINIYQFIIFSTSILLWIQMFTRQWQAWRKGRYRITWFTSFHKLWLVTGIRTAIFVHTCVHDLNSLPNAPWIGWTKPCPGSQAVRKTSSREKRGQQTRATSSPPRWTSTRTVSTCRWTASSRLRTSIWINRITPSSYFKPRLQIRMCQKQVIVGTGQCLQSMNG